MTTGFYKYKVEFGPEIDSLDVREDLLDQLRELLGEDYLYDGGDTMFLEKRLPKDNNEFLLMTANGSTSKLEINLIDYFPLPDGTVLNLLHASLCGLVITNADIERIIKESRNTSA